MPNDLPPWYAVYQQSQRWLAAGCFEALAQDLRALLRLAAGRDEEPTAAIIDSRTLRSTPESGPRAGYDGAKRKRGSKVHMAVDTLGHLLALHVTPANVDDRAEVGRLAADIQEATGDSVELAYVDQGYTGENAAERRGSAGRRTLRRQTARGEARLRPAAQALGRRTVLRLGDAMPPARQRLRALCRNPRRLPRHRLRRLHAQTRRRTHATKCITPSSRRRRRRVHRAARASMGTLTAASSSTSKSGCRLIERPGGW